MSREERIAAALCQLAAACTALAEAVTTEPDPVPDPEPDEARYRALITEWGPRGLTQDEARDLFLSHGFAPQAMGGWARGRWMELREDGLRYLTERSIALLAPQPDRISIGTDR